MCRDPFANGSADVTNNLRGIRLVYRPARIACRLWSDVSSMGIAISGRTRQICRPRLDVPTVRLLRMPDSTIHGETVACSIPKVGIIIPIMGIKRRALADALFSRTQQRVMGLLFGSPERSFYLNEVTRLAGMGIGTVQRELQSMASAGLLTVTRVGNQKHFQANRASPIFNELRAIAVKTFGVADVLREALAPVLERIEAAFVFGSLAKGTDRADSDIDVMIVSERLTYPEVIELLGRAEQHIGRKVNPTLYKPAELRRKLADDNGFLRRVMEQPKLPLIGSTDGFAEPRKARKNR